MTILLLLTLPWAAPLLALPLMIWPRHRLRRYAPREEDDVPSVTVIVPARDEVVNIGACTATLLDSLYAKLDVVVVVDDRSGDGTAEVAQALAERSHGKLRVVHGEALPEGWVGKSWACWQGYRAAEGELLLFTDADTRHDPELVGHAVAALLRERADMLTALPHQQLESFWERVVMPTVLTLIFARFLDLGRVSRTRKARDAAANGQFILVRREAYEAIGGHEAVKGEVVEDVRLAQRAVDAGQNLFLAWAADLLQTRMYRSFRDIVDGWTKNLAIGSRLTVGARLRPAIPWLIAAFALLFWVLPAAVLLPSLVGLTTDALLGWSAATVALSLAFWVVVDVRMRVPPAYALVYPLGAAVTAWLFVRSARRGGWVEWRGRRYGGG